MEYKEFAKFYDLLYKNKDYEKEVNFIKTFLRKEDKILDLGCGTGLHSKFLCKEGYQVDGLDLSKEMLKFAKGRINGKLYNQNILDMKISKKYDVVISMFAVFNHFKNLKNLELALKNVSNILKKEGLLIFDLHNQSESGFKIDELEGVRRKMEWVYNPVTKIEKTKLYLTLNGVEHQDEHIFRIHSIEDIEKLSKKAGFEVIKIYGNYDVNLKGSKTTKNLQFILKKIA